MSPGGWIHPHVMDGFGVLHNVAQYERHREGLANKNDILMHVVIKDITVSTNHNYLYLSANSCSIFLCLIFFLLCDFVFFLFFA
jgi:hypothetical protein